MKLRPKTVLLLLPLVVWVLFIAHLGLQLLILGSVFPDIDHISWGEGEKQITVEISEEVEEDLEIHQYVVTATDKQGKQLLRKSIIFDLDVGRTGFVSPMQADNDDAYEIVVVTGRNAPRPNDYFLDYSNGKIKKRPLSELDPQAIRGIRGWMTYNAPNPSAFGFFMGLTLLYYILFFPMAWLIKKFFSRKSG